VCVPSVGFCDGADKVGDRKIGDFGCGLTLLAGGRRRRLRDCLTIKQGVRYDRRTEKYSSKGLRRYHCRVYGEHLCRVLAV
jgi:hypothetical protein